MLLRNVASWVLYATDIQRHAGIVSTIHMRWQRGIPSSCAASLALPTSAWLTACRGPRRYRQQMEVFKQTQAAAGLVGAASAGDGLRRDADTQPRDILPRNAGSRDPGVEASAGTGGGRLSGRGQGAAEGAGAIDAGAGRSRDQEMRDMRAGMLGVDPGAFLTAHEAGEEASPGCLAVPVARLGHLLLFCWLRI